MNHTRREFLASGIKGVSLLAASSYVPAFLTRTAAAAPASREGSVLVVVQLGGGNDGLNTLVPYSDDLYHRARPSLRIDGKDAIRLDDRLAFHPALDPLKRELDAGRLAVVQNVGYPNPNRSHFRSMEIWHTAADADAPPATDGWIGRFFDAQCAGMDPASRPGDIGLSVGKVAPHAFRNRSNVGIAIDDPDTFQWNPSGESPSLAAAQEKIFAKINRPADGKAPAPVARGSMHGEIETADPHAVEFLRHTAMNAQISGDSIRGILRRGRNYANYPQGHLGAQLQMVARLLAGGFPSRVYYVSQGGYDTHAAQAATHARLLGDFGASVSAFLADLRAQKASDRVAVLAFSEFGRRVHENGSGGTDHGAAAPVFVLGDAVRPGIFGEPPDLADLDDGDIRHRIDFRQVYATLLDGWLAAPSQRVLGRSFDNLPIL